MKTKNKIIALIVALVFVASVFVVGTVANTKTTSVSLSVDKAEISAGNSAKVTVSISANYPVATMSIPVFYDKTLISVSGVTAALTNYEVSNVTTDATAVDSARVYADTGMDSSKYGFVLVNYIGGAGANVPEAYNGTVVLTFNITAISAVTGDAVVKCVTESAKTDENPTGTLYFGATTSGTTITSIPENVKNIDVSNASKSVTITSGGADLLPKGDKPTVVDSTNKYIYGITPGDDVADYIRVNNGSFELVANSLGKTNGTGTTVKIKNTSGEVVDTYTVIIFGDVNGDSDINGVDDMTISQYTSGTTSVLLEAPLVAADVNGDGTTNGVDEMLVSQYTSGTTSSINTNPYSKQ